VAQLRRIFTLIMAVTLLLVAGGMAALYCVATGGRCWGLFG
jgi:hypothetical protein